MFFSKPTDNKMLFKYLVFFKFNNYMELFRTDPAYFNGSLFSFAITEIQV